MAKDDKDDAAPEPGEKPETEGNSEEKAKMEKVVAPGVEALLAGGPESAVEDMRRCMTQFSSTFEASARRWELVVYPSLLAFIILAAYGFYLIYKLTNDVDRISNQFERIAESMFQVSDTMVDVSGHMGSVTNSMETMTQNVTSQDASMQAMMLSMERMNQNMGSMSHTMHQMRFDTASMGHNMHNATGPMRFMNNFMPW